MTTTPTRPRARRENPADRKAQDAALDEGIRITLDGQSYELRVGDITSSLTRELRAKSGMSFNKLMEYLVTDPDSDVIAAAIWVARRTAGEDVAFEDVEVSYRQLLSEGFDVSAPGVEEVDSGPEA